MDAHRLEVSVRWRPSDEQVITLRKASLRVRTVDADGTRLRVVTAGGEPANATPTLEFDLPKRRDLLLRCCQGKPPSAPLTAR